MNAEELNKLWKLFDVENRKVISFEEFQNKLGVNFSPGDTEGICCFNLFITLVILFVLQTI